MNELQKRLKKQVRLSIWIASLSILAVVTIIVGILFALKQPTYISTNTGTSYSGYTYNSVYPDYGNSRVMYFISLLLFLIILIAEFVLWIISIVNSVRINGLVDGQATTLVIFSIFPLLIVGSIIAVITKNNYFSYDHKERPINQTQNISYNGNEQEKLRQAFMSGIITSKEYETKKETLKKKRIAEIHREL